MIAILPRGVVNIIGEHQDYNGGHVFPAALTCGIWGAMRLRDDSKVRLYSENMEATIVVDINDDSFTMKLMIGPTIRLASLNI